MAGVAVVTDSTASLTPAEAAHAGVSVIALQVVVDDRSRLESEVPPAEVARALRAGHRVTTSRPSPEAIATLYADLAEAGHTAVVAVHLSAKMSGTYAAAELAARSATLPVLVVDSEVLALGTGFAALAAAAAARAGAPASDVAEVARRRAAASTTFFYVDSLDHLRRGGRIGTAAAMIGSVLAVKPLLTVTDGEIRPYERVRTEARALTRLAELGLGALARAAAASEHVDVAVHHLDNPGGAARLAERLVSRVSTSSQIVVTELGAVLGGHVGPGTVGIVVSPRV